MEIIKKELIFFFLDQDKEKYKEKRARKFC